MPNALLRLVQIETYQLAIGRDRDPINFRNTRLNICDIKNKKLLTVSKFYIYITLDCSYIRR